ncbi:MAG: hypothetical protein AB7R40_23315 [Nitrospiraceae bacterium]
MAYSIPDDGLGLLGAEVYGVDFPEATPEDEGDQSANAPTEALQSLVTELCREAKDYYDSNIQPDQVEATDYYWGRPFGDEEEGRSQVVSTDLRDSLLDKLPDLLEIFCGSETTVEFKPRGPEDTALAEQQTDTVNSIILEDNNAFVLYNSLFKDAGVRRMGWSKWYYDNTERVVAEKVCGMTEQDLQLIAREEGVTVEITDSRMGIVIVETPEGQQPVQVEVFDAEVRRKEPYGQIRVEALPPEEVIYTPEARDLDGSAVVAHTREVWADELRAMGISEEQIKKHQGKQSETTEQLSWSRSFYGTSGKESRYSSQESESHRPVLFTEAYAWVDINLGREDNTEPGIAELRMFQCLGENYEIVNGPIGEPCDMVPMACFTQEIEPHTIPGLCDWDHNKDVQRIKSQVKRAQLNSLSLAVEPQMEVGPGVNLRDLQSPEINNFVRVRTMGTVREIKTTFVGQETLDILAYYDRVKGDRMGQVGPSEGIDPNILQSTTAEAVNSTLSARQKRTKMIARAYAETGMKRMFKGILKLLVQHKNEWAPRQMRLRNKWVEVDPRSWDADRDVSVAVGLGTGSKTEQILALSKLAEKQEAHIQSGSPLVSFVELRNTYDKLAQLLGYKDSTLFFKKWGPEEQQALEQAQQQNPPNPDPAMELVKIEEVKMQTQMGFEAEKLRMQAEKQKAEMEMELLKIRLQDDREKDKIAREFVLKERELELTHLVEIRDVELSAQVEKDRVAQAKQE